MGLARAVASLSSGLSGGLGAGSEGASCCWLAGCAGLPTPRSSHPPGSILPLRGFGGFYLKGRSGPFGLSHHSPNRHMAWGLLQGPGRLAANLEGGGVWEGSRTSEDKISPPPLPPLPPCLLPSSSLSSSSKTHVSNPLAGPLSLPSPFPFPLGVIHCIWNSLGDPQGLITQLRLGVGRALSAALCGEQRPPRLAPV